MAMAQFAGSSNASAGGGGPTAPSAPAASSALGPGSDNLAAPAAPSAPAASQAEIHALLGKFDGMINQMMDYPAKDVINSLTMLAERAQFAPEIVSFLETKIHRVPANYKLPIFYLTDSILKNVGGPYPSLFGRVIVPLYCNCVRQVSGKDLRRFVHVLNTWESSKLFAPQQIAQMRAAANRALAVVDPSAMAQPVSFSQEPPPQSRLRPGQPAGAVSSTHQQQDMELRSLLTKLQNDMGIHPTEHMSLEEVRTNNPAYYNQLLEFHAASLAPQPAPLHESPGQGILPLETATPIGRQPVRDPRRGAVAGDGPGQRKRGAGAKRAAKAQPPARAVNPSGPAARPRNRTTGGHPDEDGAHTSSRAGGSGDPTSKSANVAHLMDLLKRKQRVPSPPKQQEPDEIASESHRGPDPAAVMSILQKLKGLSQNDLDTSASSGPAVNNSTRTEERSATASQPAAQRSDNASRMWFSEKVITHKDRVESNVQKLYAALPLVCRESGLRFKEQAKLNAHLDFLFQYNRAQKERGKGGVSRSWYPDEDQWVTDVASDNAPREGTSSSFFDRKESEEEVNDAWENARVPVDENITRCRICGENFARSWDEEEEDWMYTNAVMGTIRNDGAPDERTIFHKYCYETVMSNSAFITPEHLIPLTPQRQKTSAETPVTETSETVDSAIGARTKRAIEQEDSDSDEDDVKRIRTD